MESFLFQYCTLALDIANQAPPENWWDAFMDNLSSPQGVAALIAFLGLALSTLINFFITKHYNKKSENRIVKFAKRDGITNNRVLWIQSIRSIFGEIIAFDLAKRFALPKGVVPSKGFMSAPLLLMAI